MSVPAVTGAPGSVEALRDSRRKRRVERAVLLLERRGQRLKTVPERVPSYSLALEAQYTVHLPLNLAKVL